MRPRAATLAGPAVAAVLLALAGCAGPGARPSAEPQVDRLAAVTLQRTGGIAGVRDQITVSPDGRWRRAGRAATPTTGTLRSDQNAELTRMAADPGLTAEATRSPDRAAPGCADALAYAVSVGSRRVAWEDCGSATGRPAAAGRIAQFLLDNTNDS